MDKVVNLESVLCNRLGKTDLEYIAHWASDNIENLERLFSLAGNDKGMIGSNALWCMTHLRKNRFDWLQSKQDRLIDLLLEEGVTARKRMLLQLLREQDYYIEDLRVDFLDFCMTNINSECEPYAIRCFSLYIAYKMCRHYPELLDELKERISILSREPLSPGMLCAVRKVSVDIKTM